jgi:hypothetical protein
MRRSLRCRIPSAFAMCIAAIVLTACSAAPRIDGGIVGTGNRVDCEAQTKKDGTPGSSPEQCKRASRQ